MIVRDVVAIGSAVRDAFFETDLETVRWEKTPSGKALALPLGGKAFINRVLFTLGGNAANASVTFARQGLRVSILAKIGEDVAGEEIRRIWNKERVNTDLVMLSDLPTSYSVLLLQDGERSIITYRGASNDFDLRDVKLNKLKSKWWYISLSGDGYKALDKLLQHASKNNIKVALNPSDKHLRGAGKVALLRHLKKISFLVVNEGEAAEITGIPFKREKRVFKKLDELVPGIVAVTSGPKGVTVSDGNFIYKAGIFKNKKVVDRTGAGDAFGSGFVTGLIRKKEKFKEGLCNPDNVEYAIRLASANATSVVEYFGASEGTLTKRQFDRDRRFKILRVTKKKVQ